MLSQKFQFSSAENSKILARSNFNSSANVGPLMTNSVELESWHQGEFIVDYLEGVQDNYKIWLSVEGKQTVLILKQQKNSKKGLRYG